MSDRPNILLVSWDSVRADHLSTHGYERETAPFLSGVADDGLVFEDAQVPGVGTITSFSGAFTGAHADATQQSIEPADWKAANADRRLLSEALSDAGYHTGAVHSNALMSRFYGWDRGWDVYKDNVVTESGGDSDSAKWWNQVKKERLLPTLRRMGVAGAVIHGRNIALKTPSYVEWERMWDDVEQFVRDAPEPWFLWVLLVDTHHPWCAPPDYREWEQPGFRGAHAWNYVMRRYPEWTGDRRPAIVNAYDNEIRHADGFLRKLDGLLEEMENDDAALVVHSDHGDELGEHGEYGHSSQRMYDTLTRVPLVMRNVGETGRVDGPHTLLDLGSTVLDIAGSDERLADRPSLLGDEREKREWVVVENLAGEGDARAAAVGDEWKVLHHPDTGWHAYYRPDDPLEREDRWGGHPEELEAVLRAHLVDREGVTVTGKRGDDGDDGMSDVQERLTNLGYID
ncbi:sulfatase-like hydrolase/transferase [Haloprofundus halobius]|uniref:sulfatase-like hydrolase/transferase n=1 Tax=Haloprofundus halobius TaxID=2876194 RepID=UPI001CCA00C2|nr:sulfatase-like hydrolase/transferase [Haloprofundus halobius]